MRREQDVGDEIERERRVLGDDARVIGRALVAGAGVHHAADILDGFGELARVAGARALEGHVLEEMGDAVQLGRLPARADALPHAERCGGQARHRIERDAHAVGEADEVWGGHAPLPLREGGLGAG